MLFGIITVQQNRVTLYLSMGFIWGFFERAKSFPKHWYIFVAWVHSSQNPEGKILDILTMVKKKIKKPILNELYEHTWISHKAFSTSLQ